MEQRLMPNYAAVKDVRILSSMEEFALSMEQRSNYAVPMDVQTLSSKEECA